MKHYDAININSYTDYKYFIENKLCSNLEVIRVHFDKDEEREIDFSVFINLKILIIFKFVKQLITIKNANIEELYFTTSDECFPKEIFSLVKIKKIQIISRCIEIPDEWKNLKDLRSLRICGDFHKIPNSICSLINLNELSIESKFLTCLPQNIGHLQNLTKISIGYNNVSGLWPHKINLEIPHSFKLLKKIKTLELCQLTNQINCLYLPIYFKEYSKLEEVIFYKINKVQFLEFLPYWKGIRTIKLVDCNLGEMPKAFLNCKKLEYLALDNCNLKTLPTWIEELDSLRYILIENDLIEDLDEESIMRSELTELMIEKLPESLNKKFDRLRYFLLERAAKRNRLPFIG